MAKFYLPTKEDQEATNKAVGVVSADVTYVRNIVDALDLSVAGLKTDISTVQSAATELTAATNALKTSVTNVKTDTESILSNTVTLKTDVSTLKTAANEQKEAIDSISTSTTTLTADTAALKNDTTALKEAAKSFAEAQDKADTKLDTLQATVESLKERVPESCCIVTVELNPAGSTYEVPSSDEDKAALLDGAKVMVSVAGFAAPLEVKVTTLEGFYAKVAVPASASTLQGIVTARLGASSTAAYAVTSASFNATSGTVQHVMLTTSPMSGTRVELARCQPWNSTAAGAGSSYLMTVITSASGTARHVGYYDAAGTFHNECKTSITYWKCPKASDGTADTANNEEVTVLDGGENSVNIMDRLAVLKSIKVADVTFTGDTDTIEGNKFIRFTGPLYVKTTLEDISIPVTGSETPRKELCCVKWFCCDFTSDTEAEAYGYHRHPFFIRYTRDGDTVTETPTTYGYIARYPIKSYNLTCNGTSVAIACSKSDGSNEVGNHRAGFLSWCRAANNAKITIAVDGEESKVIEANSDSRAASMFELRELSFMQHMAYLFFGVDVQATMAGICTTAGDAYAQQANGLTDYIMDQGILTGGEDPTSRQKQIVFLGVEGAIWSAPGMMYPNFTSIVERITTADDAGAVTTTTHDKWIYAVDRNDFNPGSSDEMTLLSNGYKAVPFYVGSGNTRQGTTELAVLRDAFLPVDDKTAQNINVAGVDTHWQGGAPAAIAAYNAATAYSADAYCIYSNKLYKALEAVTGEQPDTSDKWQLVTGTSVVAQSWYMVAVGYHRGRGTALGAFCIHAYDGLAYSNGYYWRSRLSLQEVS